LIFSFWPSLSVNVAFPPVNTSVEVFSFEPDAVRTVPHDPEKELSESVTSKVYSLLLSAAETFLPVTVFETVRLPAGSFLKTYVKTGWLILAETCDGLLMTSKNDRSSSRVHSHYFLYIQIGRR
jgi:hypothetical protein